MADFENKLSSTGEILRQFLSTKGLPGLFSKYIKINY